MSNLLAFTIIGIVIGSAYAIAASGLVITYATSNVFNMAHGAVGMVMAFLFWELSENQGLPTLLALVLVVGVAAPLFGALIERTMMRRLTDASVTVSITVTVALLVVLFGLAWTIWPPMGRRAPRFFAETGFEIGDVVVTGHEVLTFVLALVVAAALYYLMNRTRTGIAMRAIVDDRNLVSLHGARPAFLGMLSWAIGSALAALAGILLASELGLGYIELTLLVINAYAAAMVGRLTSLPRTIVGAMILGLLQAYFILAMPTLVAWLPEAMGQQVELMRGALRAAVPTIFLFVVMLLMPQTRLRAGKLIGAAMVRVPRWGTSLAWGAGLIVGVVVLTGFLSTVNTARLGQALAIALIMLSLVVLTGYGGDVSLGQMSFVGVGALVIARYFETVTPGAVIAATVAAGIVGALVAIPALRLRGLYLALATLAFARGMDLLVFQSEDLGFGLGGSAVIARPDVLGISLESERAFTIVVAISFVLMAFLVLAIRRGRFGRRILATRDSPAACGTLGLNTTATRVGLFAVSAAMAGFGGAMYAGMFVSVGPSNFAMFESLPLLLLAVVGGITSITGALIGGSALGLLPAAQEAVPALAGLDFIIIGFAAIGLARYPNGIAGLLFAVGARLRGDTGGPETPAELDLDLDPDDRPTEEVSVVGAP